MLKLNGRKAKAAGFIGTVALTGGLLASAVVGTGAYFSGHRGEQPHHGHDGLHPGPSPTDIQGADS